MFQGLRTIAAGLLVLAVQAVPAFAHAHLVSATPPADASVAVSPGALVLHFTEAVEPGFTGLLLKDAGGAAIPTGATTVDAADSATITVPVEARLATGHYLVYWHALAGDGHKTSGSYGFVVTP